jgi:hypothetical protein
MHSAKPIFLAVLAVTFAAYAFDCAASATPQQAMDCCNSMPCPPHSHNRPQDCCKSMPEIRAPFIQPASVHHVSYSAFIFAVLPVPGESHGLDAANPAVTATNCHAPSILSPPASPPLRI